MTCQKASKHNANLILASLFQAWVYLSQELSGRASWVRLKVKCGPLYHVDGCQLAAIAIQASFDFEIKSKASPCGFD